MRKTKSEVLGLNYEIVRDWMNNDYENEKIWYPIEKFVTNFDKSLSGSLVRIRLTDEVDEIIEIK